MDGVQLSQDYTATMRRQFTGCPGTYLIKFGRLKG